MNIDEILERRSKEASVNKSGSYSLKWGLKQLSSELTLLILVEIDSLTKLVI